ncbi:uncharacterized protein LOC125585277 [Brassica napus]|nr:uncharacterized protein LOC125585277 [Brassica napus]
MNSLSHLLNKAATENKLGFHSHCKKTKLTHLSFADDLLIFIDGSIESVQCVLQVLKDFEIRSGPAISMQKTSFFASGLTDDEINRIQVSTGMSCGSLPFRYLGVPLNSRKLSLSNCNVLLQQMKSKFSSWSIKTLSFSGRTGRFWTDNWSPYGCLETFLDAGTTRLGIPTSATIASLYRNGSWRIPSARSVFFTTINLTEDPDFYEWHINGKTSLKFKTSVNVQWASVAWPSRGIPRHSFHCWLVIKDRLPTRDRLLCLLCNTRTESRSQLFWDCNFSFDLWSIVSRRCGLHSQRSWEDSLQQMVSLSSTRSSRLLTIWAWQAAIYWLWNERNARLHANTFRAVDTLFMIIDRQLRNKIFSFRDS